MRRKWLDRLFEAVQQDDPPCIESLGDHWSDLCATAALASDWADQLRPTLQRVLRERGRGPNELFRGTSLCCSALFKAGRRDELLDLLALDRQPIWAWLVWGGRVLAARGEVDAAIVYVSDRAGSTRNDVAIARFAEDLLLEAGQHA